MKPGPTVYSNGFCVLTWPHSILLPRRVRDETDLGLPVHGRGIEMGLVLGVGVRSCDNSNYLSHVSDIILPSPLQSHYNRLSAGPGHMEENANRDVLFEKGVGRIRGPLEMRQYW